MNFIAKCILLLCCLSNAVVLIYSQCNAQVGITSSSADEYTFGYSVGISGSTAVVGSPLEANGSYRTGSAYVFVETSPGVWIETQKLVPSDASSDQQFGGKVAISGSTMIFGTPRESSNGYKSGAVYFFRETSPGVWTETQKVVSSDNVELDSFGQDVSIHGSNAIIGAYLVDAGADRNGASYVFFEVTPGVWTEQAKLIASDFGNEHHFGNAVDIHAQNIIIGAYKGTGAASQSGSAYVFSESSPGVWTEVKKLSGSDSAWDDEFAYDVSIALSTAVVAAWKNGLAANTLYHAGCAYVYTETSPGNWVEVQKLVASDVTAEAKFGRSVSNTDTYLLVGASHGDLFYNGASYVFAETTPGSWVEVDRLISSDQGESGSSDSYGWSTAIDEETILVGSLNIDKAYFNYMNDVDDCAAGDGHMCMHGATCVDSIFGYCCVCPDSHTGEHCEDCLCENGGVCQDDPDTGMGHCDCTDVNYSGTLCTKFCNNGVGETYPDTGCNCTLSGATGKFCTEDVDDCLSSPCANGGTCTDFGADLWPYHNNEFNCTCDESSGFHGPSCEHSDCESSPCFNNGVCEQAYDLERSIGIQCNCTGTDGYGGKLCQTEVDECSSSPCLHKGICIDFLNAFSCDCTNTGYEGPMCSDDIDDCVSSPCQNDGVCEDRGANKFKCTCDDFWEGDTCSEDVDDCILKGYYCENGAACANDPVNMGDVLCDCSTSEGGFTGKYCNVPIEDACVTVNHCFHGGKCVLDDITKVMSCDCANTGYEGDKCDVQVYVSECVSSPCLNEGQCYDPSDYQDDWFCNCDDTDGFFGEICESASCDSAPCQHGGSCTGTVESGYICSCLENFSGAQCQINDNDGAQLGSSSSSSQDPIGEPGTKTDDDTLSRKEADATGVIIAIVVSITVIAGAAGGYVWYNKNKAVYTMPT